MSGPDGRADPRFAAAGIQIAAVSERFSQTAQQYIARETLHQRAIQPRSVRKKKGNTVSAGSTPQYDQRQIVSFYGFTTIGKSAVIHETRQMLTVDKEIISTEFEGRRSFRDALLSRDDVVKQKLLNDYDRETLRGIATDLGQMVLLFDRTGIQNFTFAFERNDVIGGRPAMVLRYVQRGGGEGVRITESGKQMRAHLQGWLWLRLPDYLTVRITMVSNRTIKKHDVRDEAEVDYAENVNGALLPSHVVHRRWEDDILAAEDDFQYSDWQPLK